MELITVCKFVIRICKHLVHRGNDERSYPASEVRGGGQEEIPHTLSARPGVTGGRSYPTPLSPRPRAAARSTTPCPRSRGYAGTGGPRGAIPR